MDVSRRWRFNLRSHGRFLKLETRCLVIEFSNIWPACFNEDDSVVRHELGHAFVWLSGGGAIEHVRFTRAFDRLLGGGMKMTVPDGWDEERFFAEKSDLLAERVLAGEIAAREHNGLPQGVVCSELPLTPTSDLAFLLTGKHNHQTDDIKALFLAHESAKANWYEWMRARHSSAVLVIQRHFEVIDIAADVFAGEVPLWEGDEVLIDGARVARQLGFNDAAR